MRPATHLFLSLVNKPFQTIHTGLTRLLQRTNEDAFVIFTHPATGKFVQFAGSDRQPLRLDLPFQVLAPSEIAGAIDFFKMLQRVIAEQHWGVEIDQEAFEVSKSFQVVFGTDVQAATRIALGIFLIVFRLPESLDLDVEEN